MSIKATSTTATSRSRNMSKAKSVCNILEHIDRNKLTTSALEIINARKSS